MIKPIIHVLAILNFSLAIYGQLTAPPLSAEEAVKYSHLGLDKFGGPWKYLTFWNLWVQLGFFVVCLANDVLGRHDRKGQNLSRLERLEDFYYSTIAFPVGILVAVMFWGLYAVDRELVFPKVLDKYISVTANHMMHTFVVPFQLFELLTVQHAYPTSRTGPLTTAAFSLIYLVWCLVVAEIGGFWVYPILGMLSPVPRMLFLLACSAFGSALYFVGQVLNTMYWGKKKEEYAGQKKKKVKSK